MIELRSHLFRDDVVLQAIAEDLLNTDGSHMRISTVELAHDPAVLKVQTALLDWRPDCLPQWGADGSFGDEAARAVHRFKVEELGVPEAGVIDDVGPQTVQRLDQIRAQAEADLKTAVGEAEGDVIDIPLLRFNAPPDVLPPEITVADDVFGSYEIVNLGTAPSTGQDNIWFSITTQNVVFHQSHHMLDNPPIDPGNTYRDGIRIRGSDLQFLGAWQIVFLLTDSNGQIADEATVPFDIVAPA